MKQKVTVTSVTVETAKFLFRTCKYTVKSDVGMGDILLVLEILHVCGHTHEQLHVSRDGQLHPLF